MIKNLNAKSLVLGIIMCLASTFVFAGSSVRIELINNSNESYAVQHTHETCWNGSNSINNLNTSLAPGEVKVIYTETNNSGSCNSYLTYGNPAKSVNFMISNNAHNFPFRIYTDTEISGIGSVHLEDTDDLSIRDHSSHWKDDVSRVKARITITPGFRIDTTTPEEKLEIWEL